MNDYVDIFGNDYLYGIKEKASDELLTGQTLKTAAAAGDFFSQVLNASMNWDIANKKAKNTGKSLENKMLALDNEVMYYKNEIADKFNKTMARNSMIMAAKGLRVTAANLLEQTKGAAYDATKDIETLESNTELKKIALWSEEKQANIARHLTKQLLVSDLVKSGAKLGLQAMALGNMGASGDAITDVNGNILGEYGGYGILQ